MERDLPPETDTADDVDHTPDDRTAAVIAADDTGMLSSEAATVRVEELGEMS